MADRKISDLTALTTPAAGDYLPIVDISEAAAANKNKRITIEELMRGAPDGTFGAPGFAFESDPNTGIYSPGADQLAISTGGSGRLFVDSSGNIGINVASPTQARLVVASSAGANTGYFTDGTNSTIKFVHGGGGAVITTEIGQYLGLGTADNERLRITSTGQLSHIGAGSSSTPAVSFSGSAPVNSLVVDSSGRCGIGTSSPSSALDVSGAISLGAVALPSAGTARIFSRNTDSNLYIQTGSGNTLNLLDGSQNTMASFGSSTVTLQTGNSPRLSIDSSGRVGIGTTSPAAGALLHVKSSGLYGNIVADNSSATGGGGFTSYQNGVQKAVFGTSGYIVGDTSSDAALFAETGGNIRFYTNGSTSDRARIDSSGRLLVGTSSGSGTNLLQIQGSTAASSGIGGIALRRGVAPSGMGEGSVMGYLDFGPNDGGIGCQIVGVADGTQGTNDYPGRLVFSTTPDSSATPVERMRITNAGLHYFMADGNDTTRIQNTAAAGTATSFLAAYHSSTAGTVNTGTLSLNITTNGNITNTNNSYGAISDIKLKENIVDANSQWDDIKALQVRNYNFKEGQTHTQIGLVAQEVELVSPGLVSESPDRDEDGNDLGTVTKSVNYSVLYMKAVKALQEAMERIETLEAKVAALETK